jgi:hypothetical protein
MEWLLIIVGWLAIVATLIASIAVSFSAIAFVFEQRELARDRESRERCRVEIALAIHVDADMFEKHPLVKQLLKDVAREIERKKSGGIVRLDNALQVLESNSKAAISE